MSLEKNRGYGREFFALSANQHVVSVNIGNPESHAATHFEKHKNNRLWHLAQAAVRQTLIELPDQSVQVDMGTTVGQTDLVRVKPSDEIFYFQRPNRGATWYPGVEYSYEDRPETSSIVVITNKIERADVLLDTPHPNLFGAEFEEAPQANLLSAYPGTKTPGVPGANPKYITAESFAFWQEWALAVDPSEDVTVYDGIPEAYRQS